MHKTNWRDCPLTLTHGNIVQRVMFTKKGPPALANVLRYIDSFSRGYLEPGVSSRPHTNERVQEVFFVASGSGKLVTPAGTQPIRTGDGILIPPDVGHTLVNDGTDPLELLLVIESVPEGTDVQNTAALVRNYQSTPLAVAHWSYLVHALFGQQDGLVSMRDVLVVLLDPMTTGDNHGHDTHMEEVWYMWQGEAVHIVSQEVCVQTPGTAVSVCPSKPGHTLVNHSDQPVSLFYFCSDPLAG